MPESLKNGLGSTTGAAECHGLEGHVGKYLLIESRDPYEYADTNYFYDLARHLAHRGNEVAFYLIDNGVLVARSGPKPDTVGDVPQAAPRMPVHPHLLAARERGSG